MNESRSGGDLLDQSSIKSLKKKIYSNNFMYCTYSKTHKKNYLYGKQHLFLYLFTPDKEKNNFKKVSTKIFKAKVSNLLF